MPFSEAFFAVEGYAPLSPGEGMRVRYKRTPL